MLFASACVARNLQHHSLWLTAGRVSLRLVQAWRMHAETSRCATAADKVTSSWPEARADLVAQVCTPNKAKAPCPSWEAGLHFPWELPFQDLGPSCNELTSAQQPELGRSETIQEMSYTMFPWQLVESTLQKDKNAEVNIPLHDLNYFNQGWF